MSTINHTTLVKNVYSCIRHKKVDCILEICLFSGIRRQGRGVLVFWGFSGDALTASRASVATLAIFASRGDCKNACWGASPNPRRHKVRFVPFPPCGENCTRSLAPPLPAQPAALGLRGDPKLGTSCPKVCCLRHRRLSLLFLIFALVRQTEQIIDIRFDRHSLPHFLLGRPVLGIEGFFPRRKFAALFF